MQNRSTLLIAVATTSAALVMCSGCQSRPAPLSLAEMQNREVRKLAAECYSVNEGLRVVLGGGAVWGACERWARDRLQVNPRGRS